MGNISEDEKNVLKDLFYKKNSFNNNYLFFTTGDVLSSLAKNITGIDIKNDEGYWEFNSYSTYQKFKLFLKNESDHHVGLLIK